MNDDDTLAAAVDELTYRSYWYQRQWYGVTAEQAAYGYDNAAELEARYQGEQA